jgi:hypothetical protein
MKKIFVITAFFSVSTMYCMYVSNCNPDTASEVRSLVLYHGGSFEGKDLRSFMYIDKAYNALVKLYTKTEFEKYKGKKVIAKEIEDTETKSKQLVLRIVLEEKTSWPPSISFMDSHFDGYTSPIFGHNGLVFKDNQQCLHSMWSYLKYSKPFVEEDRISFYGKYSNSVWDYIIKYSWSVLGQGQQRCEMTYKDTPYQLGAYANCLLLMHAILSSTIVNKIERKNDEVPVLEYDLKGVQISDESLLCNSFVNLKNVYKNPILERYAEQHFEQQK